MKTKGNKRKHAKTVTPFDYEAFKRQAPSTAEGKEEIFDPDRNRPNKK